MSAVRVLEGLLAGLAVIAALIATVGLAFELFEPKSLQLKPYAGAPPEDESS